MEEVANGVLVDFFLKKFGLNYFEGNKFLGCVGSTK
jgi:hypothetical protein